MLMMPEEIDACDGSAAYTMTARYFAAHDYTKMLLCFSIMPFLV